MNTLYLDIFSGISGDMFLGAMLDLGVDLAQLRTELAKLGLEGYQLHVTRAQRSGIEGVKFDVRLDSEPPAAPDDVPEHEHEHDHDHDHDHDHRRDHQHSQRHPHGYAPVYVDPLTAGDTDDDQDPDHDHAQRHDHSHDHDHAHGPAESRDFAQIQRMIDESQLSTWVRERAIAVFRRIAVAEGKIHGHPPEQVHFHEVGAVDSIVDIVGACIALELLNRPRVLAASVVEGTGWVRCAHGRFPVPTAATLEILGAQGIAVTQCEEPHELVTPTGAALLAEFVERFGPMQNLVARRVGYGIGSRHNQTRPNVLRAVLSD